ADGASNAEPILHTIEVVPDLSPEVQILRPESRRLELPQDGRQLLEARAIDPDFGLTALNLKANHGGRELFNQPLLTGEKQPRQQRGEFVFEPLKLGLPV